MEKHVCARVDCMGDLSIWANPSILEYRVFTAHEAASEGIRKLGSVAYSL